MTNQSENHIFTARTAMIAIVTIILTLLVIVVAHAAFDTLIYMHSIAQSYR